MRIKNFKYYVKFILSLYKTKSCHVAVSQSVACSTKSTYTTTSISATSNSKISITRITNKSQINQDKSVYLNNDKFFYLK
jgi:hypothetical protein